MFIISLIVLYVIRTHWLDKKVEEESQKNVTYKEIQKTCTEVSLIGLWTELRPMQPGYERIFREQEIVVFEPNQQK